MSLLVIDCGIDGLGVQTQRMVDEP